MKRNTNRVYLVDVTNREGAQTSRILLPKLSKTMLNIYLDEMGIYQGEIGFPTLKHEINYINANLELARTGGIKRLRLEGWCRAMPMDVELAFSNCPDLKHISLSMPTSDIMLRSKLMGKKSWNEVVKGVCSSIKLAKELGAATVGVSAEDASRTDLVRLIEYAIAGRESGADRFRYSDTLGLEDPLTINKKIRLLAVEACIPIEMHCHNDLGMAEAVSLAGAQGASEAGVDCFIDTTVNGYGERSGNCDLISATLAMKFSPALREKLPLDEHVDLTKAWKISRYTSYAFNISIPINQPGVGANIFAHESGIHADGALKHRRNYDLYDPEDVGRGEPELLETGRIFTTGEYGGIKGFRHVYSKLGIEFYNDGEARNVFELVQYANLHTQKPLTNDELRLVALHPDIVRKIVMVCPENEKR